MFFISMCPLMFVLIVAVLGCIIVCENPLEEYDVAAVCVELLTDGGAGVLFSEVGKKFSMVRGISARSFSKSLHFFFVRQLAKSDEH